MGLLFTAVLAVSPSPSPRPTPAGDVCGAPRSNLLATLNRPSIGYSPCAAKPGDIVAEIGYQNGAGDANLAQYPQGFMRFGASPGLELDYVGPAYAVAGAGRMRGYYDSGLGAKFEWWHDGGRALATDFLYIAPTGASQFTAGAPIATVNVDYTMPLSSVFSIGSTIGVQSDYAPSFDGHRGRFFTALPSIVLTDGWNPRAQAFIEAFSQTRLRPDGGALFGLDAAMQYLVSPSLEADVEAGRTITDVNRQHYVGFGFGVRF